MEENTMKRLAEMEGALNDATTQVEDTNSTVQKLEVEHSMLKKEMKVVKLQAVESAASCQKAFERENRRHLRMFDHGMGKGACFKRSLHWRSRWLQS
ncbi:hypothetical protein POUND7_012438 [Theobroma cacao]